MNVNKADNWVKLHRGILWNGLSQDNNEFIIFVNLLLMAHHRDNNGSVRLNGKQVRLRRGQLSISQRELADKLNMPRSTVRNALSRLQEDHRVDQSADHRTSIITICNWDKYQPQQDQPEANERTTRGPLTSVSENREVKNKPQDMEAVAAALALVKQPVAKNTPLSPPSADAQQVVAHYNQVFGTNISPLPDRLAKVRNRLEHWEVGQLIQAIDNARLDPFFNGEGPRQWQGDLDYLIRNDVNLEKYLLFKAMAKKEVIF